MPEVYTTWAWSKKFPAGEELRRYFQHVDEVLDISKDVEFGVRVTGAQFDAQNGRWDIKTNDGRLTHSRFFILGVGISAKPYIPKLDGLDCFEGLKYHPSQWPKNGIEVEGKQVAIIGTGATGVQLIQEWGKSAKQLVVCQRTPNIAMRMGQEDLSREGQDKRKAEYPGIFKERETTFSGMIYHTMKRNAADDTHEERQAVFERLWGEYSFAIWLANYQDILADPQANRWLYDFWVKKTRERINDPRKKDILAPLEPPHPFGTKRPSLEQNYYETFNQPNVELVDLKQHNIEIKPNGILVDDGTFYQIDAMAIATGYDAVTGSMLNMDLRNVEGRPLSEDWKNGARSHLGMTRHGYPNMFFLHGAHGPTALSNGPSGIELQGRWVIDAIKKMLDDGINSINPTEEAEQEWKANIYGISDKTLFPLTNSWYMGANIPGKKKEPLNYGGGLAKYEEDCWSVLKDWRGFVVL